MNFYNSISPHFGIIPLTLQKLYAKFYETVVAIYKESPGVLFL